MVMEVIGSAFVKNLNANKYVYSSTNISTTLF